MLAIRATPNERRLVENDERVVVGHELGKTVEIAPVDAVAAATAGSGSRAIDLILSRFRPVHLLGRDGVDRQWH